MRKYLNNGMGAITLIFLAVIAAAIAYGRLSETVTDNEVLAADNKQKIEKIQEQYSNDIKLIAVNQAAMAVEQTYIKNNIQDIKRILEKISNERRTDYRNAPTP